MRPSRSADRRVRAALRVAGYAVRPGRLVAPGRSAWRHGLVIQAAGAGTVDAEGLGYIRENVGPYIYPN